MSGLIDVFGAQGVGLSLGEMFHFVSAASLKRSMPPILFSGTPFDPNQRGMLAHATYVPLFHELAANA